MTTDEAIELNNKVLKVFDYKLEEVEKDAIQLGIEALKRIEATRLVRKRDPVVLLPGETKD